MIPYGHQSIDEDDISAVVSVLRGDRLTQGPKVDEFERVLAAYCGARYAVVMNSGTAALHAAYTAAGLGRGDEFITSPMTFAATANAGLWNGAVPVFVDIDPETGNIDPNLISSAITPKTKAIVPIDYTGRPPDLNLIWDVAKKNNLVVIEDACQALGASFGGKKIGSVSDMATFSFHPVKSITTGEGGAVLTNDEAWYKTMKKFVTHGMTKKDLVRTSEGPWYHTNLIGPHMADQVSVVPWYMEQQMLGQNYRLTDMQCALGISQLKKLDVFIEKRRRIAEKYTIAFRGSSFLLPPDDTSDILSAWHLYVIRLSKNFSPRKAEIVSKFHELGIGVQVHHIPVYTHPYYRDHGYRDVTLSKTEEWYAGALSLPIYPDLTHDDQQKVIETVLKI